MKLIYYLEKYKRKYERCNLCVNSVFNIVIQIVLHELIDLLDLESFYLLEKN